MNNARNTMTNEDKRQFLNTLLSLGLDLDQVFFTVNITLQNVPAQGCTALVPYKQQQPIDTVNDTPVAPPLAPTPRPAPAPVRAEDALSRAVRAVQSFMWGRSAYAVIYCEMRDRHGYPNNMSLFEREMEAIHRQKPLDWPMKPRTLSGTIGHNRFMLHHVDEWKEQGAPPRALLLLEKFRESYEISAT